MTDNPPTAPASSRAASPANMLGLDYRAEALRLPWQGPIWDVHVHLSSVETAQVFFEVADLFGVQRVWSMSPLEQIGPLRERFGQRLEFIAVPTYAKRDQPETFTTAWLKQIEQFAAQGVRICKFWAAPRGRDLSPALTLDHPLRLQSMKLARSLGMMFMVHVADPDTWFASIYRDASRYGTKAQQYEPLERLLDEFGDVPWLAAHMAGDPEHLDHLQNMLDRHPNLHLDCSATKWMVRELSKHPSDFRGFCQRNSGRVLFGSDQVVSADNADFDLYASRYWALRTLLETDYDGPSPIVDPDLSLVDPSVPKDATAHLRGAKLDAATLAMIYQGAAQQIVSGGW